MIGMDDPMVFVVNDGNNDTRGNGGTGVRGEAGHITDCNIWFHVGFAKGRRGGWNIDHDWRKIDKHIKKFG